MKTRKLFTAAAIMLAAIACQPTELDNITPIDKSGNSIKITATIDGIDSETKVTYEVLDNNAGLKPSWDEDVDEILVFTVGDETIKKALYSIESVTNGVATFKFESGNKITELPQDTKVYGIYYPGKGIDNIVDGKLAVDISNQNGTLGDNTPAIMCATATVGSDGSVNFDFKNQTAIVGIKMIQVGSGNNLVKLQPLNSVQLGGVSTTGTIKIVNNELKLVADGNSQTIIANPEPESAWTTDNDGCINFATSATGPLSFVVIPSGQEEEPYVTAVFTKEATGYTFTNSKAIEKVIFAAGGYYYMSKKLDCEGEAVAKVNGKRYATINAAFEAANDSPDACTITLLADCSANSRLNLTNTDVNGAVTLDLNGFKLTGPTNDHCLYVVGRTLTIQDSGTNGIIESAASSKYPLYLGAGANVTLNTGTITHSVYRAIRIDDSGNFTMNGGTVSAADGNYGIALAGSGDIRVTGGSISGSRAISYITLTGGVTFTGTLEVSGGTLEGNSSYSIIITGKTTISGGYFNSSTSCIDSYGGNVTVTGGYFASTSNTVELFIVGNSGKCAVRGGYFDRPINSSRTGNSYRNILNTDDTSEEYPFKVADSGSTYYINSTTPSSTTYTYYFNNISAASKHAQQTPYDVTIKLNGNSNPGNSKVVLTNENDKTITLDLNNKTITTNAESFITTTGELTITDNSANKGGTITSKKNNVITVDGTDADVEISNCNIITSYDVGADETYNYRTIYHNGGKITITDAEIEATNASAIYSGDGELTIDNAIITSKYYGLYVLEKTNVTITGDDTSFYSSDYSCIWSNAATVSIKIEGGYFYSTGENTAVTSSDSAIATFTFTGGYFSKVGTLTGSTGIDNIQPLATPATHSHSGVGELNYSYKYVEP